jgi:LppX_LprAFG lipoprotein
VVIVIVVFAVAQRGGGGSSPLNAIAKAAEVTQRQPGGRAVIKATVTSLTTPEGITESGTMTFDDSGRARGELTVSGLTTGKEVKLVSIADGTSTYVSSDDLDQTLPDGKKWMELDLGSAAKGVSSPDPAGGGPEEGLKILERVHGSEEVGKEDIGGVATTHYRGTLAASDEVFGVKVDISAPQINVWIDAQDRVRRMQLVVSGSVGEVSTKTEMTIDYVEFGRVPKIALPDPSEVFNATSKIESQVQSAAEGG